MLKLLTNLEIGETINVSTMSKVSHNSYLTATTRWLYGENRNRTITMIEEDITSALLTLHKAFSFSLCYDIAEAYQGIQNLVITYKDDKESVNRLRKCMEGIEKYLTNVGHFNLLELKKNSKQGIWKKFNALMISHPNLMQTKWMKNLIWKIVNSSCIAGGKVLEPLLEDENKRSRALKFIGPIALKYIFFTFYSKTKFLNMFLKIIMFSLSQAS
jgi:hypothetical protein